MKRRVAIEDSLENVKNLLKEQGYDVHSLDYHKDDLDGYDAIVVSGQDDDFMGISDTLTKATVIDAAGKTPMDVYNQIHQNQR